MTTGLPFQRSDPARRDYQYLEDLATAYWYSEALFAALELNLFSQLDKGDSPAADLAETNLCRPGELARLLTALERLALVQCHNGRWSNSQLARCYLVPGRPDYLGNLLLYRRYMQPSWPRLAKMVAAEGRDPVGSVTHESSYALRNRLYVQALDALARQKASEILGVLDCLDWPPTVIDIGGGAGALSRAIVNRRTGVLATLVELPEVLQAARELYPAEREWTGIRTIAADFRSHPFNTNRRFGIVLLSNCLHAYGWDEACALLEKGIGLLAPGGVLLIHDYFPDRRGCHPHKGALYDLAMMLNTYNGMCHHASRVVGFLEGCGLPAVRVQDLKTDSSIILVGTQPGSLDGLDEHNIWIRRACDVGFNRAVQIRSKQIETASWVRLKCRCGCPLSGTNHQCPPNGMNHRETRELLDGYSWGLLVEGAPPGKDFHRMLRMLEKQAFTSGFHKALAFGAGPCPICETCSRDTYCRYPERVRPSLEGSGVDVYTTARNAGLDLEVLPEKGLYVKYIGLVLME